MRVTELGDWEPLDERTLLVWAPDAERAHLIRLGAPIPGLLQADTISVVDGDRDGIISACGEDGILVERAGAAARIASIEYLSEERTAELEGLGESSLPTFQPIPLPSEASGEQAQAI